MVSGRGEDLSVGVALVADPLVLLAVGGAQAALHWSLLPGGPSVTSRADGLRLIRGLAAGGQLSFQMEPRQALPPLELGQGPWEDEDEWRLFEDLAVLEEWSGEAIPLPEAGSAEEATAAAQAASWARTEQIDAHITDAVRLAATADAAFEQPDELSPAPRVRSPPPWCGDSTRRGRRIGRAKQCGSRERGEANVSSVAGSVGSLVPAKSAAESKAASASHPAESRLATVRAAED